MSADITLDMATEHQVMKITEIMGTQEQKTRFLQMGFTPGTSVHIVRRAPLADPVEIKVRGTHILLRRNECQNIKVASAE